MRFPDSNFLRVVFTPENSRQKTVVKTKINKQGIVTLTGNRNTAAAQ